MGPLIYSKNIFKKKKDFLNLCSILTFAVKELKKSASPYVVRTSGFMILQKVVANSGFFRGSQYFFYLP